MMDCQIEAATREYILFRASRMIFLTKYLKTTFRLISANKLGRFIDKIFEGSK